MPEEKKKNSKRLKNYHFIILSCVLCMFFIINSNNVNKERFMSKLNQVKEGIYENIKSLRNLQDSSINYSGQVCSKASDDLIEYYKTGDKSKIDIDSDEITCEDKDKPYMQNLIAAVKSINDDNNDGEGKSLQQTGIDYGMRFIPFFIFLAFGLFGIFGWLICCFCACCNCCCCCCCCKKIECKKVCFIITYAFYAAVVGVSIFGLAVTSKAFRGMNDTGCAFLKFFDQVLYGEIDQTKIPRWLGANNITNILLDMKTFIEDSGSNAHDNMTDSFQALYEKEANFLKKMKESSSTLYTSELNNYSKDYSSITDENFKYKGTYILDIINSYGRILGDSDNSFETGSILDNWKTEYLNVKDNAMNYLTIANDSFNNILNNQINDVINKLDDGADKISKLTKPFKDLNEDLGEIFDDISKIGENYGKMSIHSIFTVLMVLNVILGGFILLICFCSMKQCTSCCCCRCLFKCVVHLSWNFLALMMISSFLFGSLLSIIGMIGGDMMSLVSYILSKENFENERLFIDKFGSATDYLKLFIHGDGDISKELDLEDSLDSFNNINSIAINIKNLRNNFNEQYIVYNQTIEKLNKEKNLESDIHLILTGEHNEQEDKISYFDFISKINVGFESENNHYKWDFGCTNNQCNGDRQIDFNPKSCPPYDIIKDLTLNDDNLKNYAIILQDADKFINNTYSPYEGSFLKMLDNLRDKYKEYLSQINYVLIVLDDIIENLMGKISPFIGNQNNFFSFLNGHFIQINIKIILKYLKDAFGKNIFSIGLSLIIVGCALILSISSTLILLAIINLELNQHIKMENTPGMSSSEMKLNNVSPFQPQNILPA